MSQNMHVMPKMSGLYKSHKPVLIELDAGKILKKMQTTMKKQTCILCQDSKLTVVAPYVRDSKEHKVRRCLSCGHTQLNPVPTQLEDNEFYDENLQDKAINDVGTVQRAHNKMIGDTIRRARTG